MQKLYLDYQGYIILDFANNNDYLFLDYDKIKKIDDLLEYVKFEFFKNQIDHYKIEGVDESNFKKHITFYHHNRALLKLMDLHKKIKKDDPCSKSVIYALVQKDDCKIQHYVNKLDDIWICKEMMHQIVFNREWILKDDEDKVQNDQIFKSNSHVGSPDTEEVANVLTSVIIEKMKSQVSKTFDDDIEAILKELSDIVDE